MARDEQFQKVVLIKFTRGLTGDEERELLDLCRSLKAVPGVTTLVVGQDQEEGTQGFRYCFLIRFESEEAYKGYPAHPTHIRLRDFVVARDDQDVIGFNFPVLPGNEWHDAVSFGSFGRGGYGRTFDR